MTRVKASLRCGAILLVVVGVAGCRRPPPAPPADALLDAIRAEERVGGLSYGEGQGKLLFAHYCTTCHGDEGKGDGQNASNLNPPPPDLTISKNSRDPDYVHRVIAQGSAAVGRSPLSPPWGRSLSPQEVNYLVAYCAALARQR